MFRKEVPSPKLPIQKDRAAFAYQNELQKYANAKHRAEYTSGITSSLLTLTDSLGEIIGLPDSIALNDLRTSHGEKTSDQMRSEVFLPKTHELVSLPGNAGTSWREIASQEPMADMAVKKIVNKPPEGLRADETLLTHIQAGKIFTKFNRIFPWNLVTDEQNSQLEQYGVALGRYEELMEAAAKDHEENLRWALRNLAHTVEERTKSQLPFVSIDQPAPGVAIIFSMRDGLLMRVAHAHDVQNLNIHPLQPLAYCEYAEKAGQTLLRKAS